MKAYAIMLAVFIFGFVTTGINDSGMFDPVMPTSDTGIDEAEVQEITAGISEQPLNPLTMFSVATTFARVMGGGFLAMLSILPWLVSWGFPVWMGLMIQGPIWLVEVSGIYQMFTGYNFLGMD
jgi:hypothetical protein